jgi:hypothetical protein
MAGRSAVIEPVIERIIEDREERGGKRLVLVLVLVLVLAGLRLEECRLKPRFWLSALAWHNLRENRIGEI